ncbi:MAG: hypothetical protein M3348_08280 [Acidobacteriota bacterium]|nr:hypothetical protein [Acidobacteriota bacterium]
MNQPDNEQEFERLTALLEGEAAERRVLEKELRRSEERFESFFRSAQSGSR